MANSLVYAILPASNAAPDKVVQSLAALSRTNCPVLYIHHPDDQAPIGVDVKPIIWTGDTIGSLIEEVRRRSPADMFIWIPPGVRIFRSTLDLFTRAFDENPEASLFISNYESGGKEVSIFPLQNDLTEREDWGFTWGIPAWALDKIGGLDPTLRYDPFYDLRLKLAEIGEFFHIKTPTYSIDNTEEKDEKNSGKDTLFFPGRGAFGGFSYLFMDPENEKEIESIFERCLVRRNAFLEPRNNLVNGAVIKENDPVISVVIPVHNRARFLPHAIESVLAGTYKNFEIIIIDNASTDTTAEVAEEYAAKDKRIKVLYNKVNIIAKALNMGVEAARGKYIAQLDSDDEYTQDALASMVDHLDNHPNCALAISYYELINEKGDTLEQFGIIKHLEYNLNNILRVDGAGAMRCWHKSVIEELGGFEEHDFPNYGEDYDLVLKVAERYDIDRVHKVLYRYRRHPGNTDALRRPEDKIAAKTLARTRAIFRRSALNEGKDL